MSSKRGHQARTQQPLHRFAAMAFFRHRGPLCRLCRHALTVLNPNLIGRRSQLQQLYRRQGHHPHLAVLGTEPYSHTFSMAMQEILSVTLRLFSHNATEQ